MNEENKHIIRRQKQYTDAKQVYRFCLMLMDACIRYHKKLIFPDDIISKLKEEIPFFDFSKISPELLFGCIYIKNFKLSHRKRIFNAFFHEGHNIILQWATKYINDVKLFKKTFKYIDNQFFYYLNISTVSQKQKKYMQDIINPLWIIVIRNNIKKINKEKSRNKISHEYNKFVNNLSKYKLLSLMQRKNGRDCCITNELLKIEKIINLCLQLFTTKNMIKLISYYI